MDLLEFMIGLDIFVSEKHNVIYKRIRHLISQKIGITWFFFHNSTTTESDSCGSLPLEKTLIFHIVIITVITIYF